MISYSTHTYTYTHNSLPDSLDFVLDTWHTIGHLSKWAIGATRLCCRNDLHKNLLEKTITPMMLLSRFARVYRYNMSIVRFYMRNL